LGVYKRVYYSIENSKYNYIYYLILF